MVGFLLIENPHSLFGQQV
jgi:hypothetical protein